jgi:signal transduction histidine kinase
VPPELPPKLVELLDADEIVRPEMMLRALLNLFDDLESVEQLRLMTRMKDRFVALVSHELRTPLTSISGFSLTLLQQWDTTSDDDRRTFVTVINEQAERMIRLVNDVLVLARIKAGALETHPQYVDVAAAIDLAIRNVAGDVDVRVDGPADLHAWIDPDHFEQALVNYLGNAKKYGSPPIRVITRRRHDAVEVRVTDEGSGVPPEFAPHLFAEFAQVPRAAASTQVGTGLGLSIVDQLMRAQHARAWYEPNEPRGACFVLELPTSPPTTSGA